MKTFVKILITICVCLPNLKAQEGINVNILSGTDNSQKFNPTESMPFQIQNLNVANKEEYLAKFYAVWDINKISSNKDFVFYIVPSLQNALNYHKKS